MDSFRATSHIVDKIESVVCFIWLKKMKREQEQLANIQADLNEFDDYYDDLTSSQYEIWRSYKVEREKVLARIKELKDESCCRFHQHH